VSDGTFGAGEKESEYHYVELLARTACHASRPTGNYDPVEEANGPKAVFSFGRGLCRSTRRPELGLVRLNRFVGAYDAGRIINPRRHAARRSAASSGRRASPTRAIRDRSGAGPCPPPQLFRYLVPDECGYPHARHPLRRGVRRGSEPSRTKGLGELTAVAVSAPAIANAVYHATSSDTVLPITVEEAVVRASETSSRALRGDCGESC